MNEERQKDLFDAINEGHLQWMRYYYWGVDYDPRPCEDWPETTKLLLAVMRGHASIVNYLLNQKGDWQDLHTWNAQNQNPLIEAITQDRIDIVKLMVAHPQFFTKSFKDKQGNHPLHYIGKIKDPKKRKAMATVLIEGGMDVYPRNDKGELPNHWSEFEKIKKTYRRQPESIFFDKMNPFLVLINPVQMLAPIAMIAISVGLVYLSLFFLVPLMGGFWLTHRAHQMKLRKTEIAEEQRKSDLAYYVRNEKLKTFVARGKLNNLKYFIEYCIEKDLQWDNPLELVLEATDKGHGELVTYLLEQFDSIDLSKPTDGETPLMNAILNEDARMVTLLLEKKSYLGQNQAVDTILRKSGKWKEEETATILHFALYYGSDEIQALLIKAVREELTILSAFNQHKAKHHHNAKSPSPEQDNNNHPLEEENDRPKCTA